LGAYGNKYSSSVEEPLEYIRGVLKMFGDDTRKQTKQKIQQINFIGLQNNRHPSQHTVGKVHKAYGNCQQSPL
jgi:hypothetical protein